MTTIKLGNGNIGITQTVNPDINEISLMFSQLEDTGRVGERLDEEDTKYPICKIQFDNIDGLDNLINMLSFLRERVYRSDYFYEKMLP